jgi:hypothetical protein
MNTIVAEFEAMARRCILICAKHSQASDNETSAEDMWYQLLSSLIGSVQALSITSNQLDTATPSSNTAQQRREILARLRSLVQETFTAFVPISSAKALSFPRLFKRLVENVSATSSVMGGTPYTEFRTIITGMMESYRSEGDILVLSKQIVDGDLFETFNMWQKERQRGWSVTVTCKICKKPFEKRGEEGVEGTSGKIILSRSGESHHLDCFRRTHIVNGA